VGRPRRLELGKIPIPFLQATVLRQTGAESKDVVLGPGPGEDFAAVRIPGGYLLVSSDPVTGAPGLVGEYAVDVNANDIATSGKRPRFLESVILLPEGSGPRELNQIASQIHGRAEKLGISIIGGHTEVSPGIDHAVVILTAFGLVKKFVASSYASAGDSLMMAGTAGVEGTAALAGRRLGGLGGRSKRVEAEFAARLSIVHEAEAAYATGGVSAMHDCTEGGVLGAIFEMSLASGCGFLLEREKVPVAPETRVVCASLSLDPLKLISSGALLFAVPRGREADVAQATGAVKVGKFTREEKVLIEGKGRRIEVAEAPEDELWRVLGAGD